jgi:hypothetical protein
LEQEQKLFWDYQVRLARLRVMYYKHYIDKRQFTYEYSDPELDEEEQAKQTIINGYRQGHTLQDAQGNAIPFDAIKEGLFQKPRKTRVDTFDAKEIWGIDFDIKIDAQQGLVESELATSQWYTNMFGNGGIQAFKEDPDMLQWTIATAPKTVLPEEMRASMAHYAEKMRTSLIAKLRSENAQLAQALQQAAMFGKAQEEQFQKNMKTANTMVRNAQAENKEAQRQLSLLQQGQTEGETKSNNAKGLNAEQQQEVLQARPTIV